MLTIKYCTLLFCMQCTQTCLVLLPIPKRDIAHARTEVLTEHYVVDLFIYRIFVCVCVCIYMSKVRMDVRALPHMFMSANTFAPLSAACILLDSFLTGGTLIAPCAVSHVFPQWG